MEAQGRKKRKRGERPVHPASMRGDDSRRERRVLAGLSGSRLTLVLAGLTALVLVLSLPGALRDVYERGGLYVFSRAFLEDIPKRLAGPGRFRFVLQPVVAAALGIRAGRADARAGKSPYLSALLWGGTRRGELVRTAAQSIANLLLVGVLLDAVCQWLILGVSHPGAALVVGPVLIAIPYSVARELTTRATRAASRHVGR